MKESIKEFFDKRTIVEFILIGLLVFFILFLSIFDGIRLFQPVISFLTITSQGIVDDEFVAFALTVNFLYEMIPQTLQLVSVGGIGTILLQRGFNPWIFTFVIAFGKFVGQMILYTSGIIIANAHGREFKIMQVAEHYFHKYHFFVFLVPPWLGSVGDGIMLTAGHQKISLIRVIPILMITNYLEAYRWVGQTLGEISLSNSITD